MTSNVPQYALSINLKSQMREAGIPPEVVQALDCATSNVTSTMDASAHAYARSMPRAFDEYGVEGVKMQAMYLLLYMQKWQGDVARDSKKLLRRWSNSSSK